MKTALAILSVAALGSSVHALDNGLARTPPMGWLSWEAFRCNTDCVNDPNNCISENLYLQMAQHMASDGFLAAGYEYVNIDDCWMADSRDSQGRLVANQTRFPHGIKWLADQVHALGLKLGIYEDYGTYTCGGYPGSINYLQLDAQTFADWGIDSLKLDGCYSDPLTQPSGYANMTQYLNQTGRPMLFSCSWPAYWQGNYPINYTETAENCNLWRLFDDIQDEWGSVESIIDFWGDHQEELAPSAGPGHWNDPDMLIIGDTSLNTNASAQTQMAIWAIVAAPMYMSNDLRNLPAFAKAILLNKDVIAVNQDPLGIQGTRVKLSVGEAWYRPLANGDVAVVLRNPDVTNPHFIEVALNLVGIKSGSAIGKELFSGQSVGTVTTALSGTVQPRGVLMYRLTPL